MSLPFCLQAERIWQSFAQKDVLQNISFARSRSGVTVVLGENGVGKSVFLRALAGITLPQYGQIFLRVGAHEYNPGLDYRGRMFIGYQSEYLAYWPEYTVREMLQLSLAMKDSPYNKDVDTIVEQFRLQEVIKKALKCLSFGYQRRLSVAISMLGQPKLLLLDEPTNGLDPSETDFFLEHIHKSSSRMCIIMASHRLEEVTDLKAEILLLKQGHLYYDGPCPDQLKEWYHAQHANS